MQDNFYIGLRMACPPYFVPAVIRVVHDNSPSLDQDGGKLQQNGRGSYRWRHSRSMNLSCSTM